MGIFKRAKTDASPAGAETAVQTGRQTRHPYASLAGSVSLAGGDYRTYRMLREAVPIIDSAIHKIVRLVGGFTFCTGDEAADEALRRFFATVRVGPNQMGISAFTDTFLSQLLTYGTAVGEMLYDDRRFYALYNGEPECLDIRRKPGTLETEFFNTSGGIPRRIAEPEKLLYAVLNPEPGQLCGTSLLKGLPFISDILLKIYQTIGTNWERVGNVRYAVTYVPQGDGADRAFAKERANQMASAWRDAMSTKECVKDFVAVGDVKVSVIGADNQVLDSEVPVRQMLEQIIAKTGLMPYMFGLNWSTSERMARQQCDILTTELEAYRRILTPVLMKIGDTYLDVCGIAARTEIEWDDITLQDEYELAQARLYNARAQQTEQEVQQDA